MGDFYYPIHYLILEKNNAFLEEISSLGNVSLHLHILLYGCIQKGAHSLHKRGVSFTSTHQGNSVGLWVTCF